MLQGFTEADRAEQQSGLTIRFDETTAQEFERKLELLERLVTDFLEKENAQTSETSLNASEQSEELAASTDTKSGVAPRVDLKVDRPIEETKASPRSRLFNRKTKKAIDRAEKEIENLVEMEQKTQEALKDSIFNMVNEMKSK